MSSSSASQSTSNPNVITTELVLKTAFTDRKYHIAKFEDKVEWGKFVPPTRVHKKKFIWEQEEAQRATEGRVPFRRKRRFFHHQDASTWVIEDSTPDATHGSRYHKYEGRMEGSHGHYFMFILGETKGEFRVLQADKWFAFKPYEPEENEQDIDSENATRLSERLIERETQRNAVVTRQNPASGDQIEGPRIVRHTLVDRTDADADFDEVVSDDEEGILGYNEKPEEEAEEAAEEAGEGVEEEEEEEQEDEDERENGTTSQAEKMIDFRKDIRKILQKTSNEPSVQNVQVEPSLPAIKKEAEEAETDKASKKRARKQKDSSSSSSIQKSAPTKKRIKKEPVLEEEASSSTAAPTPRSGTIISPISGGELNAAQLEENFKQTLRERGSLSSHDILNIFVKNTPKEFHTQIKSELVRIIETVAERGQDKMITLREQYKS